MAESPIIDVAYVAELARLKLTPEETARFQKQLSDIVGYVSLLQKLPLPDSTTELTEAANNLRADARGSSLPLAAVLGNAPLQGNDLVHVPKIVE